MNKRQAKKAFKKKYGVNPNELAKNISKIDIPGLMDKIATAAVKAFELMAQWAKEVNERITEIGLEATKTELEEKMAKLAEQKEGSANGSKENI